MKRAKRSGTSTKEVEKAERALQAYQFLFWLDKFTFVREGKTNVEQEDSSADEEDEEMGLPESPQEIDYSKESEDEDGGLEDTQNSSLNISRSSSVISTDAPKKDSSVKITQKRNNKSSITKKKSAKSEYLEEMEMNVIRDLGKSLASENKVKNIIPDSIDTYVQSLASDLRRFSEREYVMIKHEFQGILFKYQMSKFQINQPQWTQQHAQVNEIFNQHSAQAHWNVRPGIQMNNNTMTYQTGQAKWSSTPSTSTPSNSANPAQ